MVLTCELSFFVYAHCAHSSLAQVKSLLSGTSIVDRLCDGLFSQLSNGAPLSLVAELCATLHAIVEVPPSTSIHLWPRALLQYLHERNSSSLRIIKYLLLIQRRCSPSLNVSMSSLLDDYLSARSLDLDDLPSICHLLMFTSACHYSHELFHKRALAKIQSSLFEDRCSSFDMQLSCRLIYSLCLNDPNNRWESRSTIARLSEQVSLHLHENTSCPHWIVQAQHGMMMCNIFDYRLLFGTVHPQFLPFLLRKCHACLIVVTTTTVLSRRRGCCFFIYSPSTSGHSSRIKTRSSIAPIAVAQRSDVLVRFPGIR